MLEVPEPIFGRKNLLCREALGPLWEKVVKSSFSWAFGWQYRTTCFTYIHAYETSIIAICSHCSSQKSIPCYVGDFQLRTLICRQPPFGQGLTGRNAEQAIEVGALVLLKYEGFGPASYKAVREHRQKFTLVLKTEHQCSCGHSANRLESTCNGQEFGKSSPSFVSVGARKMERGDI